MPHTDLWRLKDGKLIEHWDEFNLLEVFQQIAVATVRKGRGNEPLDVAGVSSWHSKHSSCVWHGHVLFDYRPSRSQIGFTICRIRNHGFFSLIRGRADADLGRLGDLIQPLAGRIKQEWAAVVLSRITPNADSVRHSVQSLVKTN